MPLVSFPNTKKMGNSLLWRHLGSLEQHKIYFCHEFIKVKITQTFQPILVLFSVLTGLLQVIHQNIKLLLRRVNPDYVV